MHLLTLTAVSGLRLTIGTTLAAAAVIGGHGGTRRTDRTPHGMSHLLALCCPTTDGGAAALQAAASADTPFDEAAAALQDLARRGLVLGERVLGV